MQRTIKLKDMQAHITLHIVDKETGHTCHSSVVVSANKDLFEDFNVHRLVRSCFAFMKTFNESFTLVDYIVHYSSLREKVDRVQIWPLPSFYKEVPSLACSRFFANAQLGYIQFINKYR